MREPRISTWKEEGPVDYMGSSSEIHGAEIKAWRAKDKQQSSQDSPRSALPPVWKLSRSIPEGPRLHLLLTIVFAWWLIVPLHGPAMGGGGRAECAGGFWRQEWRYTTPTLPLPLCLWDSRSGLPSQGCFAFSGFFSPSLIKLSWWGDSFHHSWQLLRDKIIYSCIGTIWLRRQW